jgi:hypothetical protein
MVMLFKVDEYSQVAQERVRDAAAKELLTMYREANQTNKTWEQLNQIEKSRFQAEAEGLVGATLRRRANSYGDSRDR